MREAQAARTPAGRPNKRWKSSRRPWRESSETFLLVVVIGRARKDALAVGHLYGTRVAGLRAILGEPAIERNQIASLERIFAPAGPGECVGRAAFALPLDHVARGVLHIEVHPDVRVGPLDLGDCALELNGLLAIEL